MGRDRSFFGIRIVWLVVVVCLAVGYSVRVGALGIKSASSVSINVIVGQKCKLPLRVQAVLTNNKKTSVSVKWNVSSVNTSKVGSFVYYGKVAGYSKQVKAVVKVNKIPVTVSTNKAAAAATDFNISSVQDYEAAIKNGLEYFQDKITLHFNNYNENTYTLNKVTEVLDKYPDINYGFEHVYSNLQWSGNKANSVMTMKFEYYFDKNTMLQMKSLTESKAKAIIAKVIKTDMKDYEKELAIHDYIVNNTKYDTNNLIKGSVTREDYTDYGVLVKGVGVCEGYAKAMYRLLNMASVETFYVTGQAKGIADTPIEHAWNIVKIGGAYYHVDATFDDPVTDDGKQVLKHDYFNLMDNEIKVNHLWNATDYPKCVTSTYKFDNLKITEYDDEGDKIIVVKSYSEFYSAIKKAIDAKAAKVSLKIINYNSSTYSVQKVISQANYYGGIQWRYSADEITGNMYMKIYLNS